MADCTGVGVGTDNLASFTAALALAQNEGRKVVIPRGKFRCSGAIWMSNTTDAAYNDFRPCIEGDSARGTYIYFDNGNFNGLSLAGTVTQGPATVAPSYVRNLNLFKSDGQGYGLAITGFSHIFVENVMCYQWLYGIYGIDVQESTFINLICNFNLNGGFFGRGTLTQPNALTFLGCMFGANQNTGLDIVDGTALNFSGGSIESNGGPGANVDNLKWGLRLAYTDATHPESNDFGSINGVYMERNAGRGDIYIANSLIPLGGSITGCTFNRGAAYDLASNPKYGRNCVFMEGDGPTKKITIDGNGFGGLPRSGPDAYPPDVSRKYIDISTSNGSWVVTGVNSYADAVETPNFGSLGVHHTPEFEIGAWARVTSAGGLTKGANVSSTAKNATGNYTVNFTKALKDADFAPIITPVGGVIVSFSITALTAASFTVQFWAPSTGSAIDTAFGCTIVGSADI